MNDKLILVVDDEVDICSEISGFLKNNGFDVIVAHNGKDGVLAYKQSKPIVILSDYKMPVMNGIEMLKEIKSINKDSFIILISGAADARTIVEGIKQDAFDFLLKPVDMNTLLEIVNNAISRAKAKALHGISTMAGLVPIVNKDADEMTLIYIGKDLDEDSAVYYTEQINKLIAEKKILKSIVLMMNNVRYINNMGLNFLVEINTLLKEKGFQLFLCNISNQVDFYLRTLGYHNFFNIHLSVETIKETLKSDTL